ncbi:MAG: hypothetical protein IKN53_03385, partial [Oscillibacter sp.]|nr:hypothetical protein [Oscillibacter sp.]
FTAADGSYSAQILLPDGAGGAFSLRASAVSSDVERRSDRVSFYVDGVSVDVSDRLTVVQGNTADLTGYLNNLGVTAAAAGTVSVSGLPAGLTYEVVEAPEGVLAAQSGAPLTIRFTASASLTPKDYAITVSAGGSARTVTLTCEKAVAKARVNVIGYNEAGNEGVRSPSVTMSLRQGAETSAVIRLTNIGTAPITGVRASADIPFLTLHNVDPDAVILPVHQGYSIRDPQGSLSIVATASPADGCLTGVYEGSVTITSPSLENDLTVPVKISVGAGLMGTAVFEVRNQDNTLLEGARVTLIGLDEQLDPVRFDETADAEGAVTFENIPAGSYTLRVTAQSHTALETTVEIAAVIDRMPRVVTLSRQAFSFTVDETRTAERYTSASSTANYDSVVYKANLLTQSGEPQLAPNFVADEKEFFYQSGKVVSKLSFMDPKEANAAIDNVTVRIADADSRIPSLALAFSSGGTLSPVRNIGKVAPGEVFDIVWSLDVDRFFLTAEIRETDAAGQYAVRFPSGVDREMIDAYVAANDPAALGLMEEVSFDPATNTAVYRTRDNGDGAFFIPSDRVPLYYGATPYCFDFTLLATGERTDTHAVVETRIPVRLHYVAPDYYVSAGEPDSLYDDDGNYKGAQYADLYDVHPDIEQKIVTEPAFAPASGRVSEMRYSSGFLQTIQATAPEIPEKDDDVSLDLGFSGDVGYEGQVTTLSMTLKNPSLQYPMENLKLRLVLTDAPYDGGGNLQAGGVVLDPALNVYVDGDGLRSDGALVEGVLGVGDEASVDFSFRLDQLTRDLETLKGFDETLAQYLENTRELNKVYARIEGSFTLGGVEHTFTSGVREYEVKEKPKLYVSYDLEDKGGERYFLTATITNLGKGDANNVSIGAPALPNTGFEMKIVGVTSTRGVVVRANSAAFDRVEISVLRAGDTAVVSYELAILGTLTSAQKLSLGKLASLPSVPIKSDMGSGIVMAPMKMEAMRDQSTLDDIDEIIEELGILSNNLHAVTDKTVSELARSLADYYDYTVSLQRAISIGECYSMLANLVSLMSAIKDIYDIPGSMRESLDGIKGFADDIGNSKSLSLLNKLYDTGLKGFKKLFKECDWVVDYLPMDVTGWYDTYYEAVGYAEALATNAGMSQTFRDYVSVTKQAASVLAEASAAVDAAMKTTDAAERSEKSKLARVKMEQAASLLKTANELKATGDEMFESSVSGIDGTENKTFDLTADAIRIQVNAYIASAEGILAPRITAIAASLAQLKGLDEFEKQVASLQTGAEQIDGMIGQDERLAPETKGLVAAANAVFKEIGYDPNASAKDRLASLRTGRKALEQSMIDLAKRPAVWYTDAFNIADASDLKNVQENTPAAVKTVGEVISKLEKHEITNGQVASQILIGLFGSDAPAYSWFKTDFNANFPTGGTREEIRRYIAAGVIKLSARQLTNVGLMEKSLESMMSSGLSDYRKLIDAASASALGPKTNVYKMQESMDATILATISLLQSYKTNPDLLTGYYPSAQLLDYVRGLNTALHSMVYYADGTPIPSGRVGRYRSLWTYSGNGYDLTVNETKLGEIYTAQQLVDSLLAEGYENVADRYVLNMLKEMESMVSVVGTGLGAMGFSPVVGGMLGAYMNVASKLLDSSGYTTAMNTLDNANLYNLARATSDLTITTNLMLSKEANIATDVYSVFRTMESWRKVDPDLPIEIVTADVADLRTEDDVIASAATAALTVRNDHTGSVTVAPTIEIYDSFGLVSVESMGTKTLEPGELGEFVTAVRVPVNMLRDMGGYTAVFTFAASEAETMTIAPTFGPYVTHFNVGTSETVDYLRENAQATQPVGGTLKAGESKSASVTVASGNLLSVFAAALSGEQLALSVTGAGTKKLASHLNENDFVLIPDASGDYTVTVTNLGETDFDCDLVLLVTPDLGAVAGLDMPYAKVVASEYSVYDSVAEETVSGVKASIPVSVYETGLTEGMDVTITASSLSDGADHVIPAPTLTNRLGEEVSGTVSLSAGGSTSVILGYYPSEGTPDGDYDGVVTIQVTASRFETDLTPLGWEKDGDVYTLTIP